VEKSFLKQLGNARHAKAQQTGFAHWSLNLTAL